MRVLNLSKVLLCLVIFLAGCTSFLPMAEPSLPAQPLMSPLRQSTPSIFQPTLATPTPRSTESPEPFEIEVQLGEMPKGTPFSSCNTTVFLIEQGCLTVYDLSNPLTPVRVGQSERLGEDVLGVSVSDSRAYVVVDGDLQIWDVADVSHPNLLSSVWVGQQEVLISGSRLFLVQSEGGEVRKLSTIDISQPALPQELGETALKLPLPHRLIIAGNHLYCLYDGRVDLFDVSDPSLVTLRARLFLPTNIQSQLIEENGHAFIATRSGIWVMNITDPASPIQVGHYSNLPVDHLGVVADHRLALLSSICEGEVTEDGQVSYGCGHLIEVVDFSRPGDAKLIGYVHLHLAEADLGYIEEARFLGHYAFLKSNTGFWYVLDLGWLNP